MNAEDFKLEPYVEEQPKRKGRGPNKKGALVYIGIRIEKDTLEFYSQFKNRQAAIREALKQYIENEKKESANEQPI